jgi:hypothetical protein
MEPARKLDHPPVWDRPSYSIPSSKPQPATNEDPENQPREIKLGKMIFYLTVVAGIWFFYWFNGIQCPC